MNILKQWMETVNYRITEGSDYNSYENAYCLDSWNGEQDGHSFCVIFSMKTQEVYEVQAHDYKNSRAYRWINPDWLDDHDSEEEAWDDVKYVRLETLDDFFEKMSAIYKGEDYDTRVSVPVDFTDEELLKYMTMAHERDMTFNQFVEEALRHALDEFKQDPEGVKKRWLEFRS